MILIGADPGLDGAFIYWDTKSKHGWAVDMPTAAAARKSRGDKRVIDLPRLHSLFVTFQTAGATHLIVEEVGGLPGQSASRAFAFGFGAGALRMAAVACGFAIEIVTPQQWKAAMRVGTKPQAIRSRADEVFPQFRHLWARPPRSKSENSEVHLGRAEAALLAAYGARILGAGNETDNRMADRGRNPVRRRKSR